MKKLLFFLFYLSCSLASLSQQAESPSRFLGYPLGTQFTSYNHIVEYFRYMADVSKNVKLVRYGSSNEGWPLFAMFVGSPENIARLEQIRVNNLRLAGQNEGSARLNDPPVIVWLSYNVHGNEPSSSEAAMEALYELANPSKAQAWLKNTLIVIDPCLNPDGRERYLNYYRAVAGPLPNADPAAREHHEPWPGGRINHYYFDLNRDWAWQTQTETQARMTLYNQWLPQIHVDFHEQGYNTPYYFAPAAEPFHEDITPWQRQFQSVIGKNNARHFDEHGWMYFTHEEYDLLYPSYGDTYPIYNGAIGMTYEQGGIGAGLKVLLRSGDTLALADRIAHHVSNSLSTVETASQNATRALSEFRKYFDVSRANPPGEFRTYVIKNDNEDRINDLAALLGRNGIHVGAGVRQKAAGYNYTTGKSEAFEIMPGDLVITAYQPKAVLAHVLLEPKTMLADSDTYDITAWSLPFAYGLQAYGLKESIRARTAFNTRERIEASAAMPDHAYAYVCRWQSLEDARFLAALLKSRFHVRCLEKPFDADGSRFGPGSLIITRAGNDEKDFDASLRRLGQKYGRRLSAISSGLADKGADLGSRSVKFLHAPKVLLVCGEGTSAEALGEVWFYFEKELDYPVTMAMYRSLPGIRLSDYDVIIFPDGSYDDFPAERLQTWVHEGGRLIAMENAISSLAGKKGFPLTEISDEKSRTDSLKNKAEGIKTYANRDHEAIRSSVAGAIFKVDMDNTHPLGFGLGRDYFTLKVNDVLYNYLGDDGWNVGTLGADPYMAGFVGSTARRKVRNGLLFGVQSNGMGTVVYLVDDPLFRSFWQNGKLLFSNAVFMVSP